LLGGVRVSKSHLAVEVCGGLDETNSLLGLAISQSLPAEVAERLPRIQNDLFDLGSRVAASQSESSRAANFPANRAEELEAWIDHFEEQLPVLTQFILPGGSPAGASLHHCRAVCRRTERDFVKLIETLGSVAPESARPFSAELVYLNRLSDLLFVLARFVNLEAGIPETFWRVTSADQS
jgi:cob(I)alamin adenosyltransferase